MLLKYFIVSAVLVTGYGYSLDLWANMEKMRPLKRDMGDVSLVAAMFQLGDANQDGKLTKAEIYEYFKTVTNSFSAYIRAERFMNAGDINGDGYLTQTEALAASSSMKK